MSKAAIAFILREFDVHVEGVVDDGNLPSVVLLKEAFWLCFRAAEQQPSETVCSSFLYDAQRLLHSADKEHPRWKHSTIAPASSNVHSCP
jgi:hypothetical protein